MIYARSLGFKKLWHIDKPVDFLCYTKKEFEERAKRVSVVREALEKGIEV